MKRFRATFGEVLIALLLTISWGAVVTGLTLFAFSIAGWPLALSVAGFLTFVSVLFAALVRP